MALRDTSAAEARKAARRLLVCAINVSANNPDDWLGSFGLPVGRDAG